MTDTDEQIRVFLSLGEYKDLDEWMADSDYERDEFGEWTYEGSPVDPEEAIYGAMEACGFLAEWEEGIHA